MTLHNKLLATAFAVSVAAAYGAGATPAQANAGGIEATARAAAKAKPAYDAPVELDVNFVFHIDNNLPEQDVFVARTPGADQVYRPNAGERDLDRPLYAAAKKVKRDPFDDAAVGPWPKGKALGLTLRDWLQATGAGRYTCRDGEGHIEVEFAGLVPDGVYTMWHYFVAWPPTDPFIGAYSLPLGSRDGVQSIFTADAKGDARFERRFRPCLQLTGEHLAAGLAIAWHSDGKTYGARPGDLTTVSHIQLYSRLPQRAGM